GGLVGLNYGWVENSSASGNVTGGGNALVGGLVGTNGDFNNNVGFIIGSWATGAVHVETAIAHQMAVAGGLVRHNSGTLSASYATGNARMAGNIAIMPAGGLVGQARAPHPEAPSLIELSYASGNVTISNTYTGAGAAFGYAAVDVAAGGLVGGSDRGAAISN